jgi:hypothetical protein
MIRILHAFVWLRWRTLVNSLERTGSRDKLERFSIAVEQFGPILAVVLLIPSALMLSGLGAAAGFSLARGDVEAITIQAMRYILLLLPAIVLVGPLLLPGSHRPDPIRLLLLPIPRSTLYLAHVAAAFGEPWHILATPMTLFFAAGLLAGGAPLAALLTAGAAVGLVAVLVGLSALAASGLQLLFRDRRRGELVALIFIVLIPLASMLPAMFIDTDDEQRHQVEPDSRAAVWLQATGRTAFNFLPPQMYLTAARGAAEGNFGRSGANLAGLIAIAALVHGVGFVAFGRVLDSPASSGARRGLQTRGPSSWRLPWLSSGASAVAVAHVRLTLRTPRGRSILLSPLMLFLFIAVFMARGAGGVDFGPLIPHSGVGLAAVTSFFCIMSTVPISTNQFAVDRAGLTRTLLSPLTEMELLIGKAMGNALIGLGPALVCFAAAAVFFRSGSVALWATIPIGLVAVVMLAAPVTAIASAVFPKSVELNSIGGNNAHGFAALTGMLSFVVAAGPPALLTLLSVWYLQRPELAPAFVMAWGIVAYFLSKFLFTIARGVFHRRRENLAMLEQ